MASTISPLLSHSLLLNRFKLNASFNGTTVTHITQKSDLEAKQRRVEVKTVWNTEARLGAGAFGVVWRQRAESGKLRAVKIIPKAQLNIQEVEALIELQVHPDLFILFFGWFEDPDRDAIHIAMEYIEHGDLGHYMADNQSMVEAKEITSQILEGLVVLHERGICHRDLKPQNILVASLSPIWVKITDFGISKRGVGTPLQTHCGTNNYRSPEQLGILPREFRATGNSYTNHIDIWALGAIVHRMLTLEIPFLDTYTYDDPDLGSIPTPEETVDMDLLYAYCRNLNEFPCGSLRKHGVSEEGIEFVKSLLVANPSERASAAAALGSQWLVRATASPEVISPTPIPTSLSPTATHSRRSQLHREKRGKLPTFSSTRPGNENMALGQESVIHTPPFANLSNFPQSQLGNGSKPRKKRLVVEPSDEDDSGALDTPGIEYHSRPASGTHGGNRASEELDNGTMRVLHSHSILNEPEALGERGRHRESYGGDSPNPWHYEIASRAPLADPELPQATGDARDSKITDATYVSKEVEYPPLEVHGRLNMGKVGEIPVETLGSPPNQSRLRRFTAGVKDWRDRLGK